MRPHTYTAITFILPPHPIGELLFRRRCEISVAAPLEATRPCRAPEIELTRASPGAHTADGWMMDIIIENALFCMGPQVRTIGCLPCERTVYTCIQYVT
jgi:hypothetical protein